MKQFLQNLFSGCLLAVGVLSASGEVVAPQATPDLYVSMQYFSFGDQYGWAYSNNMGEYVSFEGDKLYIEGLCGSNWAVGDIDAESYCATFKSGQEVDEDTFIYASYKSGGEEIELDTFTFDFSADHSRLLLRDYAGQSVILTLRYASGYQGMRWQGIELNQWTLQAPEPPQNGDVSYFLMKYTDMNNSKQTKPVKCVKSGSKVWLKDLITPSYMEGDILENGDMSILSPQFQGLFARYFVYAYATMFDNEMSYFDFKKNADGTYTLEDYIELRTNDDFPTVKAATLEPMDVYTGAPEKPSDVEWNGDYAHFVNFTLSLKGENGEDLRPEWTYWQILVNDKPYVFTYDVYKDFDFMFNPDMFGSTQQMQCYLDGSFVMWGAMGDGKYRVYLPEFTEKDDIAIRCGYKVDDKMTWSDSVKVNGQSEATPLPEEALYSTSVSIDTGAYGKHLTNGLAMKAEFGDKTMKLYNFFGDGTWVEGVFTDDTRSEAVFNSRQVVSSNAYGDITIVAANLKKAGTATDPAEYTPLDSFKLKITPGGTIIRHADKDVYLLEVQGDGYISIQWCPDFKLSLVTDKMAEVPAEAVKTNYRYTSKQDEEGRDAVIAVLGDDVWVTGIFSNGAALKGELDGDDIVITLPQFVGVIANQLTYACGSSFYPAEITLYKVKEGEYVCDNDQIQAGVTYPEYVAASNMRFVAKSNAVEKIMESSDVRFRNGSFVSAEGSPVAVFTTTGMMVPNHGIPAGIYIVKSGGNTCKIAVK